MHLLQHFQIKLGHPLGIVSELFRTQVMHVEVIDLLAILVQDGSYLNGFIVFEAIRLCVKSVEVLVVVQRLLLLSFLLLLLLLKQLFHSLWPKRYFLLHAIFHRFCA